MLSDDTWEWLSVLSQRHLCNPFLPLVLAEHFGSMSLSRDARQAVVARAEARLQTAQEDRSGALRENLDAGARLLACHLYGQGYKLVPEEMTFTVTFEMDPAWEEQVREFVEGYQRVRANWRKHTWAEQAAAERQAEWERSNIFVRYEAWRKQVEVYGPLLEADGMGD